MTIVWRDEGLDDLERIDAWLNTIEGANPEKVRARIGASIEVLDTLGDIGRPGPRPGTRALSVAKAPYVIVYRVDQGVNDILALYYTAQKR